MRVKRTSLLLWPCFTFGSITFFILTRHFSRDYPSYITYFSCIPNHTCLTDWTVEPSARLLAVIFTPLFGPSAVIFLYIVVAYGTKLAAFKRMRNPILTTIVYTFSFVMLEEVTQIRAAAAIGLGILAIQLYLEGEHKTAVIVFCVGVASQYSLLALLILLLSTRILILTLIGGSFAFAAFGAAVSYLASTNAAISTTLRLPSLMAYLNESVTTSYLNMKTLWCIVLIVIVGSGFGHGVLRQLTVRLTLAAVAAVIASYFTAQGLFSRISDIFIICDVIFIVGSLSSSLGLRIIFLCLSALAFVASTKIMI